MAVAVMVDGRELSTSFIVELGQGKLIDLSPVLILRKTQFERTRIKILIDAAAVKPIFSDASIQIKVKLLFTEMIGAVVQHTIHFLLFIQAEFRKRIDSITYITGSNRCFGNLQQSGTVLPAEELRLPSSELPAWLFCGLPLQVIYHSG